jgi:hypothetical protein
MKTLRIILALCTFMSFGQASSGQFLVGGKGGINFNSFRGGEEYDVVPGFNAGAFVKYPFLDFLTLRAELLYMQQGANLYDYTVLPGELSRSRARVAFHNMQVPVLTELGLPSLVEDNLQPKLLLGAFYSYNFYARESYTNVARVSGYDQVTYEGFSDVTSQFNRSQFGLIAALATDFKAFSKHVSLEFRYHYNLNRVNRPGTQVQQNLKATHAKWGNELNLSSLSINVGILLYNF